MPLLLTAVHDGRMTVDDLVMRLSVTPKRLFGVPEQPDTVVEIDPEERRTIHAAATRTRSGWTPFEGREVRGRVTRVVLRGEEVFDGEEVTGRPGSGRDVRAKETTP